MGRALQPIPPQPTAWRRTRRKPAADELQDYGPLLPWLEAPGPRPGASKTAATDRKPPARQHQRRALVTCSMPPEFGSGVLKMVSNLIRMSLLAMV